MRKWMIGAAAAALLLGGVATSQGPARADQPTYDIVISGGTLYDGTGGRPKRNTEEAFIEMATALMSVESYRLKREVRWDAKREAIV